MILGQKGILQLSVILFAVIATLIFTSSVFFLSQEQQEDSKVLAISKKCAKNPNDKKCKPKPSSPAPVPIPTPNPTPTSTPSPSPNPELPFFVESVTQIAKEIDPDGNNNTQAVDICGADLGSMFDYNGRVYIAFGDSFGCPLDPDSPPNWRKNTMATTTDTNPSDGISFDSWITNSKNKAKQLFSEDAGTITAIPTYGTAVGSTGYLYYMQVTNWDSWTCNLSSIAKSTDGGQNWTKLINKIKWDKGNFNQVAIYKKDGFVYIFGIPCGRAGALKLAKVDQSQVEDKSAYQYLTGFNSNGNPLWTQNTEKSAVSIVPAAVGELSVIYNQYLGAYIMMYLHDDPPGQGRGIEIRSAPNLWGPWSQPKLVTTGKQYPCLYAPFMHENYQENFGQTVYFRMSRFCKPFVPGPYSTYWMKMTLRRNDGG